MKTLTISEKNYNEACKIADVKTKKVLETLFGVNDVDYSDYTNIKTYKDACKAQGIEPVTDWGDDEPDEIAYKKLKVISRALWGKDFEPKPDPEGREIYWYVYFLLYTQNEVSDMSEEKRGALLAVHANAGACAGFGGVSTGYRSSNTNAYAGFRLCQETQEKALYFGRQFIKLWADYLLINVEY